MRYVYLIFLLQLLSLPGIAADTADTSNQWIESALKSNAAHDQQWLRLGHWKKRGLIGRQFRSEYLSEADGPSLFLAPNGKTDPRAELEATLRAFFSPPTTKPDEHPQCLFPARFQWAKNKLKIDTALTPQPCAERKKWKEQLGAEGVSLIFASAYLGNAASMFGHTFLKFRSRHNRDGRDLLDYGVNFAAETGADGGVPFAVLGLTGGYQGHFTLQPFHQTLREYANLEGRDLWEYTLNLTQEELDFFIDHLFELERTSFDYYFLDENCSYHLLGALEAAKPDLSATDQFWYQVIPADSVRVLTSIPNLIGDIRYRPALQTLFQNQAVAATRDQLRLAKALTSLNADTRNAALAENRKQALANQVTALDLALDYGAVLAAKNPNDFEPINHQLRGERAATGAQTQERVIPRPTRPEEGHDPGRLGISIDHYDTTTGLARRLGLQFRFAYHDRLSRDEGYLRGTTLEVLRTKIAIPIETDGQPKKNPSVRELALLDIFSAQPRSRFFAPITWRASFGFKEPLSATSLGPYVNGGLGTTVDIGSRGAPLWISALIDGEALSNPDLAKQTPMGLGPRLTASWFPSATTRLGLDGGIHLPLNGGTRTDWIEAQLVQALAMNTELRLVGRDHLIDGKDNREWSAQVYQHILF